MIYTRERTLQITESKEPVTNIAVPEPAPVVVTTKGVTLADQMQLRNLPLATTPAGKNFAIKTLHPADHEIKAARAPGGLLPSLAISADLIDTVPFPAGAASCYIVQIPNPAVPLSIVFVDAMDQYVDHYVWANSALGGRGLLHAPSNYQVIMGFWDNVQKQVEAYRVTSQSVTVDVIAPMVADQGTIVSAQFTKTPLTMSPSIVHGNNKMTMAADVWAYDDVASANALLMGTSAYTSKAREGFYQPLKIGKYKFVNATDGMIQLKCPTTKGVVMSDQDLKYSNFPTYFNNILLTADDTPTPKPTSDVVGITWIEGTAGHPSVSLRLRARQVIEIIPTLGSTYAPMAEAPYPPDELAFKMVREIGARMKDAYPASYNDWGALKDTILKIGKSVLKYADPVLDVIQTIPGVGNAVSAIRGGVKLAQGVSGIIGQVKGRKNKKKKKQAEVSLVQQALDRGRGKFIAQKQGKNKGRRKLTIVRANQA